MAQSDSRNGVRYIVRIDAKRVHQSRDVTPADAWVDVDVPIPVAARELELIVDDLGDNKGDRAYWVQPRLR